MSSDKFRFVLVFLCFLSSVAFGLGEFSVTGAPGVTSQEDLKHLAVAMWLKKNGFPKYADGLTTEEAEKYIIEYKVSKASNNRLVLTGMLDINLIRSWVRLAETKGGGNTFKPILVVTSSIPGLQINANETAAKSKDSIFVQAVMNETNSLFQKFNARATLADGQLPLSALPKSDGEMKALKDYAHGNGHNSAFWVNLIPCKSCGGSRLDIHLYNLNQGRQVMARSDDLNLIGGDFSSASRVRTGLKRSFQQFHNDVDEVISQGTFFSTAHRVVVEGLGDYRGFKGVDGTLFSKLDFIAQSTLKRSEKLVAEFEILSPLGADQLGERLQDQDYSGVRLKFVRVEPRGIIMRYSK